jgi:hypothetical protein
MTVNAKTDTAYLPTAEFLPWNGQGRPKPRPGSFMIVVATQK